MAEKKNNEAVKSAHKGTENLKPFNTLTVAEQRKIQKKGGKASGKTRAARKTFKEELLKLLEEKNNNMALTEAMLTKALKGDTKAFEIIRDTIGEKPTDKVDINTDTGISVNIKVVD